VHGDNGRHFYQGDCDYQHVEPVILSAKTNCQRENTMKLLLVSVILGLAVIGGNASPILRYV